MHRLIRRSIKLRPIEARPCLYQRRNLFPTVPQSPRQNIEDQVGVYVSVCLNEHVRPNSISTSSTEEGKTVGQTTALDIFSWAEARAVRSVITREIVKNGKIALLACCAGWAI
jgi:hypothetical protein